MRRQLKPNQMQNFAAFTPHTPEYRRAATCEEAGCRLQAVGFQMHIEPDDEKGAMRIAAIRSAGRNYGEFLVVAGAAQQVELIGVSSGELNSNPLTERDGTWFVFPPGEDCFKQHTLLNGKDPVFEHAIGVLRVVPGASGADRITDTRHNKRVVDGDEWKERQNENADAINRAIERG
jgi:hypothetical protein